MGVWYDQETARKRQEAETRGRQFLEREQSEAPCDVLRNERGEVIPLFPLTNKQLAIFNYMVEFTQENFYQPSVRNICNYFGISMNAVSNHLRQLGHKGLIKYRTDNMSRAVKFYRRTILEPSEAAKVVGAGTNRGEREE